MGCNTKKLHFFLSPERPERALNNSPGQRPGLHVFIFSPERELNLGRSKKRRAKAHSRQAKRTKSRQIQESVGLKPNAEWKKDAKAPS